MNTNAAKPTMLVTGAGGMVGSYVREIFDDYNLLLTDQVEGLEQLNVRDPSAVMNYVATTRPDVVLHLAAATDVDHCEREPDWAYRYRRHDGNARWQPACGKRARQRHGGYPPRADDPGHRFRRSRRLNRRRPVNFRLSAGIKTLMKLG